MAGDGIPVWRKIKEAVEAGARTNMQARNWILQRYPNTNPATINAQILYCTVNAPARTNGPENQKERLTPGNIDVLYKTGRGEFEPYVEATHGIWRIVKGENGKYRIVPPTSLEETELAGSPGSPDEESPGGALFAAEAHLRDYLVRNLGVIEEGLQPFVDDSGNGPAEFRTDVGFIDIICVDKNENLVVVELKVDRTSDAVAGQILRYVNWVRRHLANGKKVRGVIIGADISDRLLYSIDSDPTIEAREYDMSVILKPPKRTLSP